MTSESNILHLQPVSKLQTMLRGQHTVKQLAAVKAWLRWKLRSWAQVCLAGSPMT